MQFKFSLKGIKAQRLTIEKVALFGVFILTFLLLAAVATAGTVYYLYSYRVLNSPVSVERGSKTLSLSVLDNLNEIIKEREAVFRASTTPAVPPAFR